MERLTYKDASGNWVVACNRFWNYLKLKFPAHIRGEAIDRLAAYENTGVEPSDIIDSVNMAKIACALHELNQYKKLGDIDRLRELLNADKLGKCFVSELKLGDTIYYIPKFNNNPYCGIQAGHVQAISFTRAGQRIKIREYHPHNQDFMLGKSAFITYEDAKVVLSKE